MKKNNLFKVVGSVILIYVLLTWIFPAASAFGSLEETARSQIGIFNLFTNVFQGFSGFSQIIIFILVVGIFYSVLDKTGFYDKTVEFISEKFVNKKNTFLIITSLILILVSSLCGLEIEMIIVFPILMAILIKMGFSNLIAVAGTFGATVIGMYGSTLSPSIYYFNNNVLSTTLLDGIWFKVILLVLGCLCYYCFLLYSIKEKKQSVVSEKVKRNVKKNSKKDSLLKDKVFLGSLGVVFLIVIFSILFIFVPIFKDIKFLGLSILIILFIFDVTFMFKTIFDKKCGKYSLLLTALVFLLIFTIAISLNIKDINFYSWIASSRSSLLPLLVVSIIVLLFVLLNKKVKELFSVNEGNKDSSKVSANDYSKVSYIIICFIVLFTIFALSSFDYANVLKFTWFNDIHTSIMEFEIGGFPIFSKLFGGLNALGTWVDLNKYVSVSALVLFAIVIVVIRFRIKANDFVDSVVTGIKNYIVPAILVALAYSVLVLVVYYPTYYYLGSKFMELIGTFGVTITSVATFFIKIFNVIVVSIFTLISSVFFVDVYNYSYIVTQYLASIVQTDTLYSFVNILFVNMYSLAILIAPTSVLMLISLYIGNVDYKSWFKFIFKLFLLLFIISLLVLSVMCFIA